MIFRNRACSWLAIGLGLTVLTPAALAQTGSAARPNIVIVLADDMGYSDLGCYGSEIETPNLDHLAQEGLSYTQFYNTGRCVPTRASLLTGLYAHQIGLGEMTGDRGRPGYRGDLGRNGVTLAEVLKSAGYRTYMAGKWHVSLNLDHHKDLSSWPLQRGFDRFYGTIIGAGSFYDPWTLTRGNEAISPANDPQYQPETFHYTQAISDHAVRFVREHAEQHGGEPFFMYVSHTAPHWPLHAPQADIEKYHGKYDAGYAAIRRARYQRMRGLGVIGDAELSPAPADWSDVPEQQRAWEARCMEVYAAMIDQMDQGVGQLMAELKRTGQWENTLILYLQDNGGCHETYGRKPRKDAVEGIEPMAPAALQTEMFPPRTRAGRPVLMGPGVMPGPAHSYIAYGRNWANVSNTPFRYYKISNHEGGIATPLIAHWPQGIEAKGEKRSAVGHVIDVMPTVVELSGAEYPDAFAGHAITSMEGQSLLPGFAGEVDGARLLMWEHLGHAAIRVGDWKLVRLSRGPQGEQPGPWELYHMATDRSEMHDLAAEKPEKVNQLAALWEKHAHRIQIYPYPEARQR